MACRLEEVGTAVWQFCPDEIPAPGFRLRALVGARAIDEIGGRPVQVSEVSTPDRRLALHVVPRIARDGVVGLAGKPASLFPDLGLVPAPVPIHIAASGYLSRSLDGTLGPIVGFPGSFAPLDHGDVPMHRVGVAFTGRVVQRGTPGNLPLAGATVEVDGLWSSYPPPNVMPGAVMEPPQVVALTPGLYGDHPSATLARCDLAEDLPQTKRLLLPAPRGARRLRLDNRQTLAVGMPLLVDPLDAGRREVIGIHTIDTGFSDDQPAWVELDYPLAHLHRAQAKVVPASVPATHDPRNLARASLAGDPIAFLNASAPWAELALIQVDDGAHALEYQWIQHYATVADAAGYFRLPRLSRLALFRLRATHPTPPQPLQLIIEPEYGLAEQNLSVAFE
jgi:hypothetical protein